MRACYSREFKMTTSALRQYRLSDYLHLTMIVAFERSGKSFFHYYFSGLILFIDAGAFGYVADYHYFAKRTLRSGDYFP